MLAYNISFSGTEGCVVWLGKRVAEAEQFLAYVQNDVRCYLFDETYRTRFELDMQALATTDMATATLTDMLALETHKENWEIGEALAQCLLAAEHGVRFPWNAERDKRTPRASLPGADLIGFIEIAGEVLLALGEVKTSSDTTTPPGVMSGRSGMIHQLDALANSISVHSTLLQWLYARCERTEYWPLFQQAIQRYLQSGGRAIKLFGMLMRDTPPHENDLLNRGQALARTIVEPTTIELCAWYFPVPVQTWPTCVEKIV